MASRSTSPEPGGTERAALARLLRFYAQEEELYARILAFAEQQEEIVRTGAAIGEIRGLLERKQDCLDEVGRIETAEHATRTAWEREHGAWSADGRAQLLAARARITTLIEEILACEERNDRELIAQTTVV